MTHHELKLAAEPFEAIKSGSKTIESRLYDEKRQSIKLGDVIIFVNRDNSALKQNARVVGLLQYRSFKDLFENNEPAKFGGMSITWLLNQIKQFYSDEDQKLHGVVGIEFVRI